MCLWSFQQSRVFFRMTIGLPVACLFSIPLSILYFISIVVVLLIILFWIWYIFHCRLIIIIHLEAFKSQPCNIFCDVARQTWNYFHSIKSFINNRSIILNLFWWYSIFSKKFNTRPFSYYLTVACNSMEFFVDEISVPENNTILVAFFVTFLITVRLSVLVVCPAVGYLSQMTFFGCKNLVMTLQMALTPFLFLFRDFCMWNK